MDIAALVASIVAVVFTGGSVWYGRGQKRAADRSAAAAQRSADAVEAVSQIERQREHRDGRPGIRVWFEEWISEPNMAVLNVENMSGAPIDAVVELVGGHRLAGFEDEPDQRVSTHTFDDLRPGAPQAAAFASVDASVWTDSTVKFVITLRRGSDVWDGELVPVELPPRAPFVRFI